MGMRSRLTRDSSPYDIESIGDAEVRGEVRGEVRPLHLQHDGLRECVPAYLIFHPAATGNSPACNLPCSSTRYAFEGKVWQTLIDAACVGRLSRADSSSLEQGGFD